MTITGYSHSAGDYADDDDDDDVPVPLMSVFEQFPPVLGQEWALPPASALPALPAGRGYGCFTLPNSTVGIPLRDTNVFTCDPGSGPISCVRTEGSP